MAKPKTSERTIASMPAVRVAITAVLAAILLFTMSKGWWHQFAGPTYHLPFWYLTYAHGFLRRAFMGTLAAVLTGPPDPSSFMNRIYDWHIAAVLALNGLILAWAWKTLQAPMDRARLRDIILLFALYFSSQFVSIMAYNEGYFDVYLLLIVVISFGSVVFAGRASNLWWLWPLAAIGVAIHEVFLFLWISLILCGVLIGRRLPPILAAWPFVCYFVMLIAEGFTPLEKVLGAFPPGTEFVYRRDVYNLDSLGRVEGMLWLMTHEWAHTLLAFALYTMPALLTCIAIWRLEKFKTARQRGLCVLAVYAPAGILVIGWDMARFLNMTCLMAVIVLLSLLTAGKRVGKASS